MILKHSNISIEIKLLLVLHQSLNKVKKKAGKLWLAAQQHLLSSIWQKSSHF